MMEINSIQQNLEDQPRTMSAVDDPDLSAPGLSLNNAGSRPKRRYSSGDEETNNPHPRKRISMGGFVKTEPVSSCSPYSTPACYEATESNLYRKSNSKSKGPSS